MPRLMSVSHTIDAVIARRKTETRRGGWWLDKRQRRLVLPGDVLELVQKAMGRKADEPLVRICKVHVLDVRREPLNAITDEGVAREGFLARDWTRDPADVDRPFVGTPREWFVAFFTHHMGGKPDQIVTVVTWAYLCECPARDEGATRYHGGNPDGCPREPADHSPVVASPALCLPCLHGCAE